MNASTIPNELNETMSLMESLLDDLDKPSRELDEATFKTVFLPLLTSKEDADLRAWVAIAGSPNGKVSIYRMVGNRKEQLFVVPPLVNLNGFTKTKYMHQDSLYERVHTAMRKIRNTPMRAKQIYDAELSQAAIEGVKMPLKDAMIWNDILVRYGIEPEIKLNGVAGSAHDRKEIVTDGWTDF